MMKFSRRKSPTHSKFIIVQRIVRRDGSAETLTLRQLERMWIHAMLARWFWQKGETE